MTKTLTALVAIFGLIVGYGCGSTKKDASHSIPPQEEKSVEQPVADQPVTDQPANKIDSTSTIEHNCKADPRKVWDENQCKDITTLQTESDCTKAGQRWENGTCNGPVTATTSANSASIDIVSPKTCVSVNNILSYCLVSTQQLTTQTAMTTWTREISGDCRGRFPIQVNLISAAGDQYPINISSDKGGIIPAPANSSITSFQIVGSGFWQGRATFDNSCRITLHVNSDSTDARD